MIRLGLLGVFALGACSSKARTPDEPLEMRSARGVVFDLTAAAPDATYDPYALARSSIDKPPYNAEAATPTPCYAKTEGKSNPCASCHTRSAAPNFADDWELQQNYSFTDYGKTNRWKNQFRERGTLVARLADEVVLGYVRRDNYAPLRSWLAQHSDAPGWHPDLDFAQGFDAEGFANDNSGWRAVRYKPFVGSFWASNGSTDDVFVRLPAAFRTSPVIYKTNLAILEAAITANPDVPVPSLVREIEPIDETAGGIDLDGDGKLAIATTIVGLPAHYAGTSIPVTRAVYPAGVELLHTVRYLDPRAPGFRALRMKELRYSTKIKFLVEREIAKAYADAELPEPPPMSGDALAGITTLHGWQLQAFIEDARGWLRRQTQEEHQFCVGCHGGVGITADQTFALPRKVPGLAGWRPQDPTGIPDVPQANRTTGEYADYLRRTGYGDAFGVNAEIASRYLQDGAVDPANPTQVGALEHFVLPSPARALVLDRAYLANVIEQSYVWGREAITSPMPGVHAQITTRSTGLGEAERIDRDTRIQLAWPR
jgi:mono/diheme cytochrome c family protein